MKYMQNPNVIIRIEKDASIIFNMELRCHYIISHEELSIFQLLRTPMSFPEIINREANGVTEKTTVMGYLSDLRMKNLIIETVDNIPINDPVKVLDYSQVPNASFPLYASLYISNKCNHSCKYCYVMSQVTQHHNIYSDSSIVDKLLKELTDKGCFYISLIGGEPFMEPVILDNILGKINLQKIYLVTNCSVPNSFDDKFIRDISQKKNTIIRTSLTHINPEIHDSVVSHKGSFSSIITTLNNLVQNEVETEVVIVATSHNIEIIDEMILYLDSINVDRIFIEYPMPFYGQILDDYMRIIPRTNEFIDLIKKYKKSQKVSVNDKYVFPYESTPNHQEDCFYLSSRCHAAKYSASIMADGNCYPCCSAIGNPKLVMGNLLSTTLESIWNTYDASFFHKRCISKINNKCGDCSIKETCIGGCPICGDIFFNDSYAGDARCKWIL